MRLYSLHVTPSNSYTVTLPVAIVLTTLSRKFGILYFRYPRFSFFFVLPKMLSCEVTAARVCGDMRYSQTAGVVSAIEREGYSCLNIVNTIRQRLPFS